MFTCYREIGTSIHLKNKYAGYIIELVVKQESLHEILDFVSTQLTGAASVIVLLTIVILQSW